MANPQKENGHLDLANEIVDAMCKLHLTSCQFRVLFSIIRKTYGWNKKYDHISYTQIAELSGIKDIRNIGRTLHELKIRNLIVISKNGHGNIYAFQKDYDLWDKPLSIQTTSEMTTSSLTTSSLTQTIVNPDNSAIVNPDNTPLSIQTMTNTTIQKPVIIPTTKNQRPKTVVVVGNDFISLYEKNFGLPLPSNKERLLELGNKYGDELVFNAITEAVRKENKGLKYIEGILKNMSMDKEWNGGNK